MDDSSVGVNNKLIKAFLLIGYRLSIISITIKTTTITNSRARDGVCLECGDGLCQAVLLQPAVCKQPSRKLGLEGNASLTLPHNGIDVSLLAEELNGSHLPVLGQLALLRVQACNAMKTRFYSQRMS